MPSRAKKPLRPWLDDTLPSRDRSIALARAVGMKVAEDGYVDFVWDGECLHVDMLSRNDARYGDILHEVGHYLMSPWYLRRYPEWGFGWSLEGRRHVEPHWKIGSEPRRDNGDREGLASLCGIELALALEYDWIGILGTHGWVPKTVLTLPLERFTPRRIDRLVPYVSLKQQIREFLVE